MSPTLLTLSFILRKKYLYGTAELAALSFDVAILIASESALSLPIMPILPLWLEGIRIQPTFALVRIVRGD